MKRTLSDVVRSPVTWAAGLIPIAGKFAGVPVFMAMFDVIWANAGTAFTVASVAGWSLAPEFSFIPEGPLSILALAMGVIFLAKKGSELTDAVEDRLDE